MFKIPPKDAHIPETCQRNEHVGPKLRRSPAFTDMPSYLASLENENIPEGFPLRQSPRFNHLSEYESSISSCTDTQWQPDPKRQKTDEK